MPEGNLIHHYARRQQKQLVGQPVRLSSPQGRFAADAALLDGQTLESIDAYGKHLLYGFEPIIHVHLGLLGHWFEAKGDPRPAVRLRLATEAATWDLIAPNRCELYTEEQRTQLLARLGPDPLRRNPDVDLAWERLHRSKLPIGAALLDQKIIAGIGNVIRNELLFEFGIHPATPASSIDREVFDRMWERLVAVMRASTKTGKITFSGMPRGERHVYKREQCLRCGTPIVTSTIGARTAYTCPTCQR